MELIHTVDWMKQIARQAREEGRIVGLIPTGGGFHSGHRSLVEAARRECMPVVVSAFRHPNEGDSATGSSESSLDADRAALEPLAVDYLFAPPVETLYPPDSSTSVVVEEIADRLEGRSRPGYLRAAATTALKLFAILQPAFVYLGRKHAQEVCVIRQMVRDLNLDPRIVVCPIVREPDGLAVGTRNGRLNHDERQAATVLHRALAAAEQRIARGERMAEPLAEEMRSILAAEPLATIDYVEIVDAGTFQPVPRLRGSCLAVVAAFIGRARLTDNMLIEKSGDRFSCTI